MEVSYLVAFGSGLVSFFAPCVVPLLPAYLAYVTGVSYADMQKGGVGVGRSVMVSAFLYILGFSLVFTLMGSTAGAVSGLILANSVWVQRVGGGLIMLFALSMLGFWEPGWMRMEHKWKLPVWIEKLGVLRAFVIGMVFATAWTPCVGPVLGAILTLAAASQTVWAGASLLFVYSLGISVPFLIIALGLWRFDKYLQKMRPYLAGLSRLMGIMLFVLGFLLFNNSLELVSPMLTYDWLNQRVFEWSIRLKLGRW